MENETREQGKGKPETVEKDVRKWVESICEFKANLEMEKCVLPPKKAPKKVKKYKIKKNLSVQSARGNENSQTKSEQKTVQPKATHKKEASKEKVAKDRTASQQASSIFENLRTHYKNTKLPTNWVSGQSRKRLVFCRVKVVPHGSQYEMVSDRGVAITNDCMVHVFIDGPEVSLNNWKPQKVETIDDIRRTIKTVDGFRICSGAQPGGTKNPCCSVFLSGDSKTCQACKSEMSQVKAPRMKARASSKTAPKVSSFQK